MKTDKEIIEELIKQIPTELKEVQNIGESGWFYFVNLRKEKLEKLLEDVLVSQREGFREKIEERLTTGIHSNDCPIAISDDFLKECWSSCQLVETRHTILEILREL